MSIIERIRSILSPPRIGPLNHWYHVRYDEKRIHIQAEPIGRKPWIQELNWDSIDRIVFKAEDFDLSDAIYIFTSSRPESYIIPTEADGGAELWKEIIRRGLFDPELAIEAASSTGGTYIWPPIDG
jgi:hypothetical protein